MMARPCKWCGALGHTQFYCPAKPRTLIKAKKRPRLIGKYGKQWLITRETWFRRHPAQHYKCYLRIAPDCLKTMAVEETTLDHIKSRTRHPELRYVLSNLAPCCAPCNKLKGSRDLDELEGLWAEGS